MAKNPLRARLCQALPVTDGQLSIRLWSRSDIDALAAWPPYPWPYEVFSFSLGSLSPSERAAFFRARATKEDRITLVSDFQTHAAIGYVALVHIDWQQGRTGNMAIRVHPDWCERGLGTRTLNAVCAWWFQHGMQALQLDVAATNQRAVRSYEKAGFARTGEFWREAPDLQGADLDAPKYDFLAGHVRRRGELPEIRFYWMTRQRRRGETDSA